MIQRNEKRALITQILWELNIQQKSEKILDALKAKFWYFEDVNKNPIYFFYFT